MALHPEGSSFPDFSSSHLPELTPAAPQSILNASAYTLVSEQQHPPYISSQRPSSLDSASQYYINDVQHDRTLTHPVATSYPESSQRTVMHHSPYPANYDTGGFRCSDTRDDQSSAYINLVRSDLEHVPSNLHISTTARHPCNSERDLLHYRQDPSAAPLSYHLEYGPNPSIAGDRTSYPMSCELTYPNRLTSRALATASRRQSLCKAKGLHARYRPGYDHGGPPGDLNGDPVHLHDSDSAVFPLPLPSIPMSNNLEESQVSLDTSYATHRSSGGFPCATSDFRTLTSIACSGLPEAFDDASSLSSLKKKRAKMHECEVCGKMFPRPSGLQTHMNTHNNVKPFPCGYPGCDRTFTVRSNAKRHFRTHGVVPVPSVPESPPGPYVIDFSAPTVMGSSAPTPQILKAPLKLRWMPPSLISRSNVQKLRALSDGESDSDDPDERTNTRWRSALSIPLRAVVPSLDPDDEFYEERNSYLDAKLYPYHPSQFHTLPGPAVSNSRSQSVV